MAREQALRSWFVRGAGPLLRKIDGLDIGWGGVQRWATARMPAIGSELHLDLACGYCTFLAQLGWRFPSARLVGLNIDFAGPHALGVPLLAQAGVAATLVQADARQMPFASETFGSVSCFMGLQDIEIGFGVEGVLAAVREAVRVLRHSGVLVVLDEFTWDQFGVLLEELPVELTDRAERTLDVRWDRAMAEVAIRLYAQGWVEQMRLPEEAQSARHGAFQEVVTRMKVDVENQVMTRGYYVPFGPVRMLVTRKTG